MSDSLEVYTREQILNGPASVRDRDQRQSRFARSAPIPPVQTQHHVWNTVNRPGPVAHFRPNASFTPLTNGGKIQVNGQEKVRQQQQKHHIPGYTGYIPCSQHVAGRRYSEMTQIAYRNSVVDHVTQENIPSDPQNNRKIPHEQLKERFMWSVTQGKEYNPPGYTGHVPGIRSVYGQTCGNVTRDGWERHHEEFENNAQERPGYAFTTTQRKPNHISSAPLPGSGNVSTRPTKLIPRQIQHLNYYCQ
jgi:hypothetical protein